MTARYFTSSTTRDDHGHQRRPQERAADLGQMLFDIAGRGIADLDRHLGERDRGGRALFEIILHVIDFCGHTSVAVREPHEQAVFSDPKTESTSRISISRQIDNSC
jgi:hypothetical protein